MVREGAITAIASTDIRGIKNEIFAHAMIEHRDPATMAEVDRNL
ncbi:MAG: hypothetical protein OK455_11125 [Thaumarchaeota archaeon]|nr:hypothetical protein [Nitrososphaerota archaeon]